MAEKKAAKKPPAGLTGRLNMVEDPRELERWEDVAKAKGLSLSAWVRMVCREAAAAAQK